MIDDRSSMSGRSIEVDPGQFGSSQPIMTGSTSCGDEQRRCRDEIGISSQHANGITGWKPVPHKRGQLRMPATSGTSHSRRARLAATSDCSANVSALSAWARRPPRFQLGHANRLDHPRAFQPRKPSAMVTNSLTWATLASRSFRSPSLSSTSMTFSTPPLPRTAGTPMK